MSGMDIIRLSVFGEQITANETDGPISYEDSRRPSNIMARQSIFTSSNQLSTIRKSSFITSRDLLELSVVGNDVKHISPSQFEYLPNLVLLNLKNNNLKSLEPLAFRGLYNLEELRLSNNDLYMLPTGLLNFVPRIKNLYLDRNQIRILQMETFHSLRNLEILDLSSNNLTYLPRTIFAKNRQLRELYLDDNMLDGVKSEWFSHALQLQKLSMNRNKLHSLDPGSLTVVRMLLELSLSGNHITRVHTTTLSAFHNLQKLDLSDNRIAAIPAETFYRTSKLTELNLSKNKITVVTHNVFGRSSGLKLLDLSNNMIDVVSRENFDKLGNLEKLDLSGNGVKDLINGTFLGLRKLRELNLARNKITHIADSSLSVSLSRFVSQLTWLNLQHNRIVSVSQMSLRTVPHLKFLNLAFNHIEDVHQKAFESQRHLNTLLLNNNHIENLPDGIFASLKNVRHLNIGYNRLDELPRSALKGLVRLDELNAQGNTLGSLSESSFQEIPALRRANFSGNVIQYIDIKSFAANPKLSHLDLSGNNLSDVKSSGDFPIRLKFLSLAENKLTTLHSDVINVLTTGGELALQNNPWYCDCHLSWLQYLIRIWQLKLLDTRQLICDQPRELSGQQILTLGQSDFSCGSNNPGSPARRPPVRERHNRLQRNYRTSHTTRRQILITTPATSVSLFQDLPKRVIDPRAKYDKSNIIPNFTPNLEPSSKFNLHRHTGRSRPSQTISKTNRKKMRPVPPRPNLVIGPQRPWRAPSSTLTTNSPTASTTAQQYPWIRNVSDQQTQPSTRPTTRPEFTRNQWWRNHLYRSRHSSQKNPINNWFRNSTLTTYRYFYTRTTPKPLDKWWKPFTTATPRPTLMATQNRQQTAKPQVRLTTPHRIFPTTRPNSQQSSKTRRGKGNISSARWWKPLSPYYTTSTPRTMPTTTQMYTNSHREGSARHHQHSQSNRKIGSDTIRRQKSFSTPKPRIKRVHSAPTRMPFNRRIDQSNKSYLKPKQRPSLGNNNHPKTTPQRPYVLTLPTTSKPKTTVSTYLPHSHPVMVSRPTTTKPARSKIYNRTQPNSQKHNKLNSVTFRCDLYSGWRLHFDKALIRRHKSEVKNYHVTVLNSRRQPACNGVLLSDWWILTSASCVERNLANRAKVRSSSWSPNYHIKIGTRELNKVIGIAVHPLFKTPKSEEYDYALMRLKYESLITKAFTPPCVMPPEWFHSRTSWVIPGVVSARFDSKKPRSNLQTQSVKVWETNCERFPASCLRIQDKALNRKSAFIDGAPLYLGYSETRWSLVGLGRSSANRSEHNKYLPVWTVLNWLETVIDNS